MGTRVDVKWPSRLGALDVYLGLLFVGFCVRAGAEGCMLTTLRGGRVLVLMG